MSGLADEYRRIRPDSQAGPTLVGRAAFLKTLGGHRRYPEAEIRNLAEELREDVIT